MARLTKALVPFEVLTFPKHHIRWKIILPYVFLSAILAIVATYLVTRLVTSSLTERFDNQLVEAGRVTADDVVRKEREHLETVRAVAFTEGVAESIRDRDTERLESLVEPVAANAAVERVEVLDAQGQRLKALWLADKAALRYEEISNSDQPATWPLVGRVLQGEADALGDKYAQIVQTSEGFVLYTAGPIFGDGQLVGAVLVGTSLDSFVTQVKAKALADITIYDFDGNPLVSTFAQPSDPSSDEARLDIGGAVLDEATRATTGAVREQRTIWGRDYDLLYGRLDVRDQAVGLYSVGLASDFIFNAGSLTRLQMALVFGLGAAAVLAIGLFLARLFTQPILRLVRTARMVTAGDLSARSEVNSTDEIGVLASSFNEMTEKLQRQHLAAVRALASAIDARDPNTRGHSARVGQLAALLGRQLDLEEKTLSQIEIGGYLHDIGKIGIQDAILLKADDLTTDERAVIREHTDIGLSILGPVELGGDILDFVQNHHERLDGSGYPRGLKDEQISLVARIAAVADMYDALTSSRPYRGSATPEEALAILRSQAGTLLDAQVVEVMESVLPDWEERRASEPDLEGLTFAEFERANAPF
jgi:putative nucleotidyltransferase with HDIG domain